MTLLAALKLLKDHRSKALGGIVVALLIVIWTMNGQIATLRTALAAKPKIVTKTVTKVQVREVRGPERIVEKIIIKPGGERIVERVIYRDKIVKHSGTLTRNESVEDPVVARLALAHRSKRWIVGAAIAPIDLGSEGLRSLRAIRGGITLMDRLDLTYAYEFHGPAATRHRAELALRF